MGDLLYGYPKECVSGYAGGSFTKISSDATISRSIEYTGNVDEVFITPSPGNRIIVKGITVHTEGVSGDVRVISGDTVIMPLYVANTSRVNGSSAMNILLDVDATIDVVAAGRGDANRTFVGISYLEVGNNQTSYGDGYEVYLTAEGEPVLTDDGKILYVKEV
jgi:hypothetical protein